MDGSMKFLVLLIHLVLVMQCADSLSPCPVYITISSMSRHLEESHIEINWGPNCPNPPESVAIFDRDPSISDDPPLESVLTDGQITGYAKTNVKLGKVDLPSGWNENEASQNAPKRIVSKCLPFYIASFVGTKLETSDCLKIQPNWMSMQPHIASTSLKNLFLPGTHCSACYSNKAHHTRSLLLKRFGFVQNFDIWTQLVFGIRYLDISVGYHENKNRPTDQENFWIVNDSLFVSPLIPILRDIRKFAILSGEAIVIDFGDFPIGFYNYPERHVDLVRIIDQELGDISYTKILANGTVNSNDLTLNEIRKEGKSVLITYNDNQVVADGNLLWPSWRKFSTIHCKSNELKEYMRKIFSKKFDDSPKNVSWIIYGIQGVDTSYSPGLHLPSARERANSINRNISHWLSGPWSLHANVVAVDFFCGSNLIDIAINANLQKTQNSSGYLVLQIQE